MEKINIMLVGSGGREHALAWALRRSPRLNSLWYASNAGYDNPGISLLPQTEIMRQNSTDISGVVAFASSHRRLPEVTVVGPEVPLSMGLADALRWEGLALEVVGPGKAGARLESSKEWAKQFMQRWHIPTAHAESFNDLEKLLDYLKAESGPYVLKADGLAAGKGVLVTADRNEAEDFARQVMGRKIFGEAGTRLLVEEFMQGLEISIMALCDTVSGTIIPMQPACDYKRAHDNDAGPNTGGMGAYSPTQWLTPALMARVHQEILEPTLQGLIAEKIDYRGIVYAGLMLTASGPKVVEFNCRLGDPETQSLLPRLKTDLVEIFDLLSHGRLNEAPPLEWDERVSCGVVLTAPGYPGSYPKNLPIRGLENFSTNPTPDELMLFHAGTAPQHKEQFASNVARAVMKEQPLDASFYAENPVVTDGGRAFNLVALGRDMAEARQRVYKALADNLISFDGMHYRRDIAQREVE